MKRFAVSLIAGTLFSASAFAVQYEVTVTNLTRGQTFTPIMVASHRGEVELFEPGKAASAELAALAEGGDIGPLSESLKATGRVMDIADSGGLLGPGESVVVTVEASSHRRTRITLAAMLIPTNDGFIALGNLPAPHYYRKAESHYSPVYDAGSEPNDELCASIPGPVCHGEPGSPGAGGEGVVHIHAGIHGIGDLDAATYDWRNPAAKVTIKRVRD